MSLFSPTCEPSQETIFGLLDPSICSPEASPASPGASPASKAAPTTSATSGPTSSPSGYASAQRRFSSRMSLGSRAILEALTGSRVTLSGRATPGGRAVCVLRTSARPTSGIDCSSAPWPTATAQDAVSSGRVGRAPNSHPGTTLTDAAEMAPWPTARATDGDKGGPNQRGSKGDLTLPSASLMAPWPSPNAGLHNDGEIWESFEARRETHKARGINGNGAGTPLQVMVQAVSAWPTPAARDHKGDGGPEMDYNARPLNEVARWAAPTATDIKGPNPLDRRPPCDDDLPTQVIRAHGLTPDQSSAATEKPASFRLNPLFSQWLMGLPAGWLASALWAMPSSRFRPTSQPARSSRSS